MASRNPFSSVGGIAGTSVFVGMGTDNPVVISIGKILIGLLILGALYIFWRNKNITLKKKAAVAVVIGVTVVLLRDQITGIFGGDTQENFEDGRPKNHLP